MPQSARPPFSLASLTSLASRLPRLLRPWDWWRLIDRDDDTDRGRGGHDRPDDLDAETARAQGRVIRRAFGNDVAAAARDGSGRTEDDAQAAYFFRPGHALVREDRAEEVLAFFSENTRDFLGTAEKVVDDDERPPVPGLVTISLPRRRDGEDEVLRTLDELEAAFPPDADGRPVVSPDHVLYVTSVGPHFCPHGEPEEPPTDVPVPRFDPDPDDGAEIRVSVVDTGWWPAAAGQHTWLAHGVVSEPADEEVINQTAIHEYGGHGTFVAGVLRGPAPKAHIQVEGALTHGGAVLESKIVAQLHQAYTERQHPQLISISAGTHSRSDFRLIAFDALMADLLERDIEPLVIAAAGNDGSSSPFWPAAFEWARGVGAVDPDAKVADYSNYGADWVDVYARGTDHVNAFPVGTYPCYEPANAGQVRTFKGLAQWSGTSFATPIVTGLVAAEMSRNPGAKATDAFAKVVKAGSPGTDPDGNAITIVGPLI
ncbi:S8 family peptidase [Nocardioides ultimimeridianus]